MIERLFMTFAYLSCLLSNEHVNEGLVAIEKNIKWFNI